MLCLSCLGHLLGSCMHTMVWPQKGRQAVPPQQRMGMIFKRVQELYIQFNSGTRVTNLKLSMFTHEDKPWADWAFLKTKGSETKHLLPCICQISKELCSGSSEDQRRTAALEAIHKFVRILDVCPMFLDTAQANAAEAYIEEFLGHYAWLHQWAERAERYCYHITVKFHMLCHLAIMARYLNPAKTWNFKCEDAVGKLSTMGHSVMMGVLTTNLSIKLAAKYRQFLHFRFTSA